MRRFAFTLLAASVLLPATQAWAGPFDNAVALFEEGKYVRAALIFRRLAENGRARAQSRMGLLHLNGTGVRQSDVQAYAWATVAIWQGNEVAVETRDIAASRLDAELLERAERVAAEYWGQYVVPFQNN